MPLPQLIYGASQVDVQYTSFATDALARFVCSTWEEATQNGGPPFKAVIVGAGMYGSYCATELTHRNLSYISSRFPEGSQCLAVIVFFDEAC